MASEIPDADGKQQAWKKMTFLSAFGLCISITGYPSESVSEEGRALRGVSAYSRSGWSSHLSQGRIRHPLSALLCRAGTQDGDWEQKGEEMGGSGAWAENGGGRGGPVVLDAHCINLG